MKNSVRDIKPYKNYKKTFITFDKKGNKVTKTETVDDYYMVILNNGSSIVVSEKELVRLGLKPYIETKKVTTLSEDIEDFDDEDEDINTDVVNNSSDLGEKNND